MTEQSSSELDHAYFRALEEAFIRLRGAPLLLSPSDWQVAKRWRREGIPLELAVRVMERIFDRQHETAKKTGIRSLRYFRTAVDQAWSRIVELGGAEPELEDSAPIDADARVARLVASLPSRETLLERAATDPEGPAAALAAALEGLPERLLALGGEPRDVERELLRIDQQLLAAVRRGLGAGPRAAIEAAVAPALDRLADRVAGDRRSETSKLLFDRYLRETLRLPVLSLFSPEARSDQGIGNRSG